MDTRRIFKLATLVGLFFPSGCSLDIPLEDRISDPNAIVDVFSARQALSAAYLSYHDWHNTVPFSALSDEFMPASTLPKNPTLYGIYKWDEQELINLSEEIWQADYSTILSANAVIERTEQLLPKASAETAELQQITDEAKALKALCYFNILRLFSPRYSPETEQQPGVILKNEAVFERMLRTTAQQSVAEIRQLISPLANRTSSSVNAENKRWMTPLAARTLLVDLAMWTAEYKEVINLCEDILKNLDYAVFAESAYKELWPNPSLNSSESILMWDFSAYSTTQFFDDWYGDDGDFLVVSPHILYSDKDLRNEGSVTTAKYPINYGESYKEVSLLAKYSATRQANQKIRNICAYRYSDLIFACAEAYARTGNESGAREVMNKYLQQRRAEPLLPEDLSGEKLIQQILFEKEKEFLGEGKRFFDLKRLGTIAVPRSILFDTYTSEIAPDDFRWTLPLPASEYRYNPLIRDQQNRGWEKHMPIPQD